MTHTAEGAWRQGGTQRVGRVMLEPRHGVGHSRKAPIANSDKQVQWVGNRKGYGERWQGAETRPFRGTNPFMFFTVLLFLNEKTQEVSVVK